MRTYINKTLGLIVLMSFYLQSHSQDIWGTLSYSGKRSNGSVFKMNQNGEMIEELDVFLNNEGESAVNVTLIEPVAGKLYGTVNKTLDSQGGIFVYDYINKTMSFPLVFSNLRGRDPRSGLMDAGNGWLYGICYSGGKFNKGVLYSYNYNNNEYKVLYHFGANDGENPSQLPILASDGNLYGTCTLGGNNFFGTLYQYNLTSGVYTTKVHFNASIGNIPVGNLVENNGAVYGITQSGGSNNNGTLFEYKLSNGVLSVKKHLDLALTGSNSSSMLNFNGNLFISCMSGGLYGHGTILKYQISNDELTKVIDFNSQLIGNVPQKIFLDKDNCIYGNTLLGGKNNYGVVFKINPNNNAFIKISDIESNNSNSASNVMMRAKDGKYYFAGTQKVSELNLSNNESSIDFVFGIAQNGRQPVGGLFPLFSDKLLGFCGNGGFNDLGTIYILNTKEKNIEKVFDFSEETGGDLYSYPIRASNGKFYLVMEYGGKDHPKESLMCYSYKDNTLTHLYEFTQNNPLGTGYNSTLIEKDNYIYGITSYGGANSGGVVFRINMQTHTVEKFVDMDATSGNGNWSELLFDDKGNMYGSSTGGMLNDEGGLWRLNMSSKSFTKIKEWDSDSTGSETIGMIYVNNQILGFNADGGNYRRGIFFVYNNINNQFEVKHHFVGGDTILGASPYGKLFMAQSGKVYLVTNEGGQYDAGTLLELDTNTLNLIKIHDFKDAYSEMCGMVQLNPQFSSIDKISNAIEVLKIYPNPSTESIRVNSLYHIKQIQIADATGQLIERFENVNSNHLEIDIKHYQSGIYFVQVEYLDGQKQSMKMIKE